MKKFVFSLLAAGLMTFSLSAASITGTVAFSGTAITAPVSVGDGSITFSVTPIGFVGGSSGSMALLALTTSPPTTPVTTNTPLLDGANLNSITFTIGSLLFTPTSFSGASLVTSNGAGGFAINLFGTYSAAGYDNTDGTLNFTFQPPPIDPSSTNAIPSYSYSASGTTVPEPSTYAMLGTALLGLGYLRRRK